MYQHNLPWRNWPMIIIVLVIAAIITVLRC
jgi:hypothetical protein